MFSGNLSSCDLLRITFDTSQPAALRPEVGNVLVIAHSAQTEDSPQAVADDTNTDDVAEAASVEAPGAVRPPPSAAAAPLVMQVEE